jgi:hypothetical protein
MTIIKLSSAGLIAIAMLATPAVAHENFAVHRYLTEGAHASAAARHVEDHVSFPAPHVGAFAAAPWHGEGDACDVGDTAHIC